MLTLRTAEMDIAEISKNGVECFNTEITNAMSDMSSLEDDSHESVRPTILFTNAEEKEETNTSDSSPQVESSDSSPQVESPQSSRSSGNLFSLRVL